MTKGGSARQQPIHIPTERRYDGKEKDGKGENHTFDEPTHDRSPENAFSLNLKFCRPASEALTNISRLQRELYIPVLSPVLCHSCRNGSFL
jgi:hypothetical protein